MKSGGLESAAAKCAPHRCPGAYGGIHLQTTNDDDATYDDEGFRCYFALVRATKRMLVSQSHDPNNYPGDEWARSITRKLNDHGVDCLVMPGYGVAR